MCNIAPKISEPVLPPASHKVVITTSTDFLKAARFTDYDCTSLPDGNYQFGECVGRFVMCSNGRAYVQFCPSGLVYNFGKGLRDYECGSHIAASPTEEKCVSSEALRPCSPKFRRCSNGKLAPSQCPGSSTFNEALSLCVYDQPECTPHAHPLPTSFAPVVSQVASHSPYLPLQPPYVHPFPPQIQFLPMTDCSGEQNINVRRLFGDDLHNVELAMPIEAESSSQDQTPTGTSFTTTTTTTTTPTAGKALVKKPSSNAGPINAQPPLQSVNHQDENGEVEDSLEASGEEVLTRRKRSSTVTHKAKHYYSMCTAKSTSEFVSLGNCHQDFTICKAAGAGLRAACPIGDLFDAQLNKCVSSQFCGEDTSYDEPLLQEQKKQVKQVITGSTTAPRPRKPPVYRPRKRLEHSAHHKTTVHSRLEHSRPMPVHPVPIPKRIP